MTLDPTTRLSNFQDSIKKFFNDNLKTIEGISVSFDKSLGNPSLTRRPSHTSKWINVSFGEFSPDDGLSSADFMAIICTRGDAEGYQLAHLQDKVVGYLTDPGTITLYRSYSDQTWTVLGAMMVYLGAISPTLDYDDGTKFRKIPVDLKWGSKL